MVQLHAQALEDRQVDRQQRLADVKARENLLLQQQDVVARCARRLAAVEPAGPAADDHDVPDVVRAVARRHTRPNSSEVLIPPNAKLLFIVIFMLVRRGLAAHVAERRAARDRPCPGSRVGATKPSCIIARQNADSSAPQAPSVCPVWPLVELIGHACRRAPGSVAWLSAMSPASVAVAWALM